MLKILPLLMDDALDQAERHYIIKALERLFISLGEEIKPYTQKIISLISP